MKSILLSISVFLFLGSVATAQTTVDFDDDAKWTASAGGGLSSYQLDHEYTDGDFSAIGGEGLRQNSSDQGGVPGGLGTYAWRLRDDAAVIWTATIATGGVSSFSLEARAWDNTPSPDYKIEVSTNMGTSWDSITTIDNTSLSNSINWTTFNGTINSANNDIMVRLVPNGSTERIMIDNFTWSPFGAVVDTMVSITTADMSVMENVGTIDITVALNQPASQTLTVDLALLSGNPAVLNGFSTETVTFLPGSTSETVTVDVVQGQLGSASEIFSFAINNPSPDLTYGADTHFQLTVNQLPVGPTACSELFFSEYIESTGTKALEIYNPTTNSVDLSGYEIRRYSNGSMTPSATLSLVGNLIPGRVFVVCSSGSDPTVLAEADLTTSVTNFNGDDAVELYNTVSSSTVDVIGEIGVDPGTSWHVGTDSTEDVTMVRMASVDAGNLLWVGGADQEWDTYGLNEYSYLGSHTNAGCPAPANPVAYPEGALAYCVGDTITFLNSTFGGTAPYTVEWAVGGSPVSTDDTLSYEATTSGTISITMTVTDDNSLMDDTTFNIIVRNNPTTGFVLSSNTICTGDTITITSSGPGPGIYTYSYDTDPTSATISASGATGNGYFTTATDGNYEILQTLTNSYGCSDTAMHTVTVNPIADASFSPLADICDTDSIELDHNDLTGVWSGTGVTDNGGGMGTFMTSTPGDHYITYTISSTCPDTYTDTVEVFASPTAAFSFTGSITVDFADGSTGSSLSYVWDFGDGNTETASDPTHTYAADGDYTVCLTVTNASGCTDSICQTVSIVGTDVTELENLGVSFYPNPVENELTISTTEPIQIAIFNVVGELVHASRVSGNEIISTGNLESGTYLIQFEKSGERFTEKLIVK